MPATKKPRRTQNGDRIVIWPSPDNRGGIEVIPELERAKQQAFDDANHDGMRRYVVSIEGGYVVMAYSDLWVYFGDLMREETVYQVAREVRK